MLSTHSRDLRTSEVIERFIHDIELKNSLTIGRLIQALGQRSFGFIVIFFALMNILPLAVVPGFSVITSIPILFAGLQMIVGLPSMWLPKKIMDVRLPHAKLSQALQKSIPVFKKLERLLKPRWLWLAPKWTERIIGFTFVLLSCFLMLPIPFSNAVFGGLIAFIALGLIEKDGLVLSVGWILAVMIMITVPYMGFYLIKNIFQKLF